ncbi:hypothetical protein GCM10023320_77360 [Pseudonocardia adelaidensis]|uniref:Uncharacterized protein n=1 Tax=Pseudonocardia adelaidensis TaxID=648754 RepID=A0ABP9P4D2_9PSEU
MRPQARARAPARREGPYLHVRMREQEPEELSPGVPARACYRYPRHAYDYARRRKPMQTSPVDGIVTRAAPLRSMPRSC